MTLILVTGLPCAGKSTLAQRLAADLALPLYMKDTFKEQMFDRLGIRDRAWSRQLSRSAFDLLHLAAERELSAGRSAILEGNFDPERESTRYAALQRRFDCAVGQLILVADGEELVRRFEARTGTRHPGHDDASLLPELRARLLRGRAAPLEVAGPRRTVDTTDPAALDLPALVEEVRGWL